MQTLERTNTVRGFLSEEGAASLLAYLQSITGSIALNSVYGEAGGYPSEWRVARNRNTVTSLVFLKTDPPLPEPMIVEMKFELPPKSIVTDVPEEHAQLIIHQGKVWTFGDLAFEDVNRFFYGIDFGLGRKLATGCTTNF